MRQGARQQTASEKGRGLQSRRMPEDSMQDLAMAEFALWPRVDSFSALRKTTVASVSKSLLAEDRHLFANLV